MGQLVQRYGKTSNGEEIPDISIDIFALGFIGKDHHEVAVRLNDRLYQSL